MKVIDYAAWKKAHILKKNGVVAIVKGSFDVIAKSFSAAPKVFKERETSESPAIENRSIFFILSSKAPASLTEYDFGQFRRIELALQIIHDEFAFDDDYLEVVNGLQEIGQVTFEKFEGNFTWLANRKAKRVRRVEEDLPEDWWNHVKVSDPKQR